MCLFLGMLLTVSIFLERRSPAICEGTVTLPTVRLTGLEPANHCVGAT